MQKIKLSQVIIVEGKYDKIKLGSVVDAAIICTNGFGIYNDPETVSLIRQYAAASGVIILTDSDSAGLQIRRAIRSCSEGERSDTLLHESITVGSDSAYLQSTKHGSEDKENGAF